MPMKSGSLVKGWEKRFPRDVLALARKVTALARDESVEEVREYSNFEVHDVAKLLWRTLRPDEFRAEYSKGGPVRLTWAQYEKQRDAREAEAQKAGTT